MAYDLTTEQVAEFATNVFDDYENERGPFADNSMPEHMVRDGFNDEEPYCRFLTLVAAVDKRKETAGKDGLWNVAKELWNDKETQWIFQPEEVVESHSYQELVDLFTTNRVMNYYEDPHIWYRNCLTFYREYENEPYNLVAENGFDAVTLLEFMRSDEEKSKYLSLTGDKVGALWVRLVDEQIEDLDRIEEVQIPVDSHIRKLTKSLLGEDLTDTEVRDFWFGIRDRTGLVPVQIDKPLWLLHKFKEQPRFGDYLSEQIDAVG